MSADIKGALEQINKSWRAFVHRGKPMTKKQVKKALEYGLENGLKYTYQIPLEAVDKIILENP